MDASDWDSRYAAADLVWSATPNAVVEREAAGLTPGRALDLAAGEGRNALWLAERGWQATAVDFSAVASERVRHLADTRLGAAADRLTTVTADVVEWKPPAGSFDLVVVAYLHLPEPQRRRVHEHAARALAPGGTLLVIAHDLDNLAHGVGGPQDPAVLYTPQDVVADLDGSGLVVERAETVRRPVAGEGHTAHGGDEPPTRDALDAFVRAHRPGGAR